MCTHEQLGLLLLCSFHLSTGALFSTKLGRYGMHPFGAGYGRLGAGMKMPTSPYTSPSKVLRIYNEPRMSKDESETAYFLTTTFPHNNRKLVSVELLDRKNQINIRDRGSNFFKTLQLPSDIRSTDHISLKWIRNNLVITVPKRKEGHGHQMNQQMSQQHVLAHCPQNAHMDADTRFCHCNVGYYAAEDGSRCVPGASTNQCPPNSHVVSNEEGHTCACDLGYEPSSNYLHCVPNLLQHRLHHQKQQQKSSRDTHCPEHSHVDRGNSVCSCDEGFQVSEDLLHCVPNEQSPQPQPQSAWPDVKSMECELTGIWVDEDDGEFIDNFEKDPHAVHGYVDAREIFHEY